MFFMYEREIVYIMHIGYKYILQTICRPALNLLPYIKVTLVLTQWLKQCWKRKHQVFFAAPLGHVSSPQY